MVNLKPWCTLRLDSHATELVQAKSLDDLRSLSAPPALIFGGGSNLVLLKDINGSALQYAARGIAITHESTTDVCITVQAGTPWDDVVTWASDKQLWGIENLALIPGLTGAAPIQNIGAYGVELEQVFVQLRCYDFRADSIRTFGHDACGFGYRHSVFKEMPADSIVITEVTLRLQKRSQPILTYPGVAEAMTGITPASPQAIAEAIRQIRRAKLPDPKRTPNVGSFFHNPIVDETTYARLRDEFPKIKGYPQADTTVKISAAWLIEQCGLKGFQVGDAGISPQHALVLVNLAHASARDVLQVIQRVQKRVKDLFGIRLNPEPRIVGG